MKFELNKKNIIIALSIILLLAVAFWYGGDAPGLQGWKVSEESNPEDEVNEVLIEEDEKDTEEIMEESAVEEKEDVDEEKEEAKNEKENLVETRPGGEEGGLTAKEKIKLAEEINGGSSKGIEKGSKGYSEKQGMDIDDKTGKDKYLTDPVPEGKPVPMEPQDTVITDEVGYAILSVRADTILDNMDWLNPEKIELVPEDGVIYASKTVEFYKGESVFNVLLREMKKEKIHMEFVNTPMYNSAYIQGINNIYEFDCGELSGWMFKVNNWFPNYGASRYLVKDGDVIEWVYTCNLGIDVGGHVAAGGE